MKTGTVFLQPILQGVIRREGLHKLQLGVAEIEVGQSHGGVHNILTVKQGEAQLVAPDFECYFGIGHDDGEMIESVVGQGRHGWGKLRITILELQFSGRQTGLNGAETN